MVRPLNKEWKFFGHKYRVSGAKCAKVDCKACQTQVSASINRLQSHIRVCPARTASTTFAYDSSSNTSDCSNTGLSDAIPASLEIEKHTIEAPTLRNLTTEQTSMTCDAPLAKKQRQSPSKVYDQPRMNASTANVAVVTSEDGSWIDSVMDEAVETVQPAATSVLNKRRLEIEEKRLYLELKRDQREERRERLELEILDARIRKEKLLAEKEGYEAKVLLALSRKQLFDQGVDEDEVNRILPISTFQTSFNNSNSATTEAATTTANTIETPSASTSWEKDAMSETNESEAF
ncbi:unnamed protein product [Peronospora belbahrii]|uniref:BED-type domain-containing protein n=1 Tax=Peronospora belbahrii TaxID=622444 RepID=A0AAU9KMB5_9STRA|nr:unnamed protein product [Peronospora belbahrii]CAH0514457.1 unnamed protein product [Peronospora belbahrii]